MRNDYAPWLIECREAELGAVYELTLIDRFNEYCKARSKGIIPSIVFAAIDIFTPKEELLRDLTEFIDCVQELYFKQHPEAKSVSFGHKRFKADKTGTPREINYPFDEWTRYFKVHVLSELGKRPREIRSILFDEYAHVNGEESKRSLVSSDKNKANSLIKNAWSGNFPKKQS
jgi:hypothetical protein